MSEPRLEVSLELRVMVERSIEQVERAFDMYFGAAGAAWPGKWRQRPAAQ